MMLFTSHLIPKRIGSDGAKDIVERFCGAQAAVGIDKFDPRIGKYICLHNFHPTCPELLISGQPPNPVYAHLTPLHRCLATLSARDRRVPFPPPRVFDWHYLKCVVKAFVLRTTRIPPTFNSSSILSKDPIRFRMTGTRTMTRTTSTRTMTSTSVTSTNSTGASTSTKSACATTRPSYLIRHCSLTYF
ncbi:hypothetical protein BS47DRAFT_242768 [Hydnum rufescens UP504]|uniref:Uncharacterized protein n=1 Tax=Hydnum rufescens UP504 TaxID=1448309 RepID=A0A9P6DRB4_9AGAM|nr:hypothetical protein BS47DRAFT_242768 [Hydnum rufescens UP504]